MIEEQRTRHPRTEFSLENIFRMVIHPTGVRQFMEGVSYELNLTGTLQSQIQLGLATSMDIAKYLSYIAAVYTTL